jgi:hypothetical protein
MFKVRIHFANASTGEASFDSFIAAREFCRNNISYTGGRVSRVEIIEQGGEPRAMWDATWDAASRYAGLWK